MVNLMGALEALPPTQRDVCAFALSSSVMLATVESVKLCASKGLFDRHFTRKLMHIAVGPIFLLLWPLFSGEGSSHLWAAAVPLAMTAKFALTGLGLLDSEADVDAMSRTGQREELLRGPLLYGLVFVCSTALAFRTVASAASLMALCAGDGMADVIGRAVGTHKLPWSSRKSWAGSLAFVCFAFAGSSLFSVCHALLAAVWPSRRCPGREDYRVAAAGGTRAHPLSIGHAPPLPPSPVEAAH